VTDFPIVVLEVVKPTTLYRGCRGSRMPELVAAMRSNYEAERRPHPAERRAMVTYMAVSMFEDGERLSRFAQRRPDRRGTHVARVELQPGLGICVADTGSEGHWSIWGLPNRLAGRVVEATPIDGARP
jgi:hypothetical protein